MNDLRSPGRVRWFCVWVVLLLIVGHRAVASQADSEHVVFMFDCSGSMKHNERFEQAVDWGLQKVEAALEAGRIVHIMPFTVGNRDRQRWRTIRPRDGVSIEDLIEEAKTYLLVFKPGEDDNPGTAIWDTIGANLDAIAALGEGTRISIVTDLGDDTDSDRFTRRKIEDLLQKRWNSTDKAGVRLLQWSPDRSDAHADVELLEPLKIDLTTKAFAQGAVKLDIIVKASILGVHGDASDEIMAPVVTVAPLTPNAPDLTVVSAAFAEPVRKDASGEDVTLTVTLAGGFPPGKLSHSYALSTSMKFRYRAFKNKLVTETVSIRPAQTVEVTVTSSPQPFVEIEGAKDIQLLLGQPREVRLKVWGNEDARGQTVALTATPMNGVSYELSGPIGAGKKVSVPLPESGEVAVTCRLSAREASSGAMDFHVALLGQTDRASLKISVPELSLKPSLLRKGTLTTIPIGSVNAEFTKLLCGPLFISPSEPRVLDDVQVVIEVDDKEADAELAFSSNGADRSIERSVREIGELQLYARWREAAPPRTPKPPKIRIRLASPSDVGFEVDIEPTIVTLDGAIDSGAAAFFVGSDEAQFTAEAGGLLVLSPVEVVVGQPIEQELSVWWTPKAGGEVVRAEIAPFGVLAAANLRALESQAGSGRLVDLGGGSVAPPPWRRQRLQLVRTGDDLSGRVSVTALPAKVGDGHIDLKLTWESPTLAADQPEPITIRIPVRVTPASVVVSIDEPSSSDPMPIYPNAKRPLPRVTLQSEGVEATLRFELISDDPRVRFECHLGDMDKSSVSLNANSQRPVLVYAVAHALTDISDLIGETVEATLRVSATNPNVELSRNGRPDLESAISTLFSFKFASWEMLALYNGERVRTMPPEDFSRFKVEAGGSELRTSTWKGQFNLSVEEPTRIPDSLRSNPVRIEILEDDGLIESVAFELKGVADPVDSITIDQLDDVAGLVIQTSSGLETTYGKSTRYDSGLIRISADQPPMEVMIGFRAELPWSPLKTVLMSVGGLLLLIVFGFVVLRLRQGRPRGIGAGAVGGPYAATLNAAEPPQTTSAASASEQTVETKPAPTVPEVKIEDSPYDI